MFFALIWLVLGLLAFIGWVMNVAQVASAALASEPLTTLFIVKLIGIPVPILGAILGWF